MKIQILSDLHLEYHPFDFPMTNADVIVLAGDIHVQEEGVKWAIENIRHKPVIYILGNHEYYGSSEPNLAKKLKYYAQGTNVHVLENDFINIGGINFLGCTLWTDYKLFAHPLYAPNNRNKPNPPSLRFIDVVKVCQESVNWLQNTLHSLSGKTVVITHHAPSKKSIPLRYQNHVLSLSAASNFDEVVLQSNALLWIHGHLHNQADYQIGKTRIICNPRGYPLQTNPDFNPQLIIEI